MELKHISTGLLGVNTYFLINERTNRAVVIDCGENYKAVTDFAKTNNFTICAVLLTHAHFDHSGIAKRLQDDGVKIYISEIDALKLSGDGNLASGFRKKFDELTPDYTFSDNDELIIEDIKFKVLLTPGHTDGSCCFIVDDYIFSGDTLFYESIGRTDFISGSYADIINSLKRLYALPGDYKVFTGHNEFTTLEHERKFNPFFRL